MIDYEVILLEEGWRCAIRSQAFPRDLRWFRGLWR